MASQPRGAAAIVGGCGELGIHLANLLSTSQFAERIVLIDPAPVPARVRSLVIHHALALGSCSDEELSSALSGVDTLFNLASPDPQFATALAIQQTNVDGVAQCIRCCLATGTQRLVHISSIAATNHLVPKLEFSEADALPPYPYPIPYDNSKRTGEAMVVHANSHALRTCALRAGGIIASPNDITVRTWLMAAPLRVIILPDMARIDMVYAPDLCRAMLLAASNLAEGGAAAGQVFNVTRTRDDAIPKVEELARELARQLGWRYVTVPYVLHMGFIFFMWLLLLVKRLLGMEVPATPPHIFYGKIPFMDQTFDNSKARSLLGYEPQWSWREMFAQIAREVKEA